MSPTTTLDHLSAHDVVELHKLVDEFVRSALAGDWEHVMTLLTDDAVWMPPDQSVVMGAPALRAWFDSFPPITAFTSNIETADGRGDFAVVRGSFFLALEPAPGQHIQTKGKWVGWYRKEDGKWRCSLDIWNADQPA
jgi:ketosteroid isomerase-like protein